MQPIRLLSSFMTVGLWTLASRVLGFARDILIAAFMGSGPAAEAFLVAFSLPNMFRRFFAEGAFNTAFVPLFAKKLEAGEDAIGFARQAFSALALVLVAVTVLAIVFMPALVLAMASGFAGDVRFDLTVDMGRVAFAYIFFISLAALLSGVLNSSGRFAAAAAAPLLLNVILIGCLLLADGGVGASLGYLQDFSLGEVPALPYGRLLVIGVLFAGFAQFALVWWAAARSGMVLWPTLPRLSPEIRRLAIIAGPAMLAGGVVQINLLVGRQVASFFDGAIVWLGLADRLYQLPLGVVGIAIGVVLLPELSRRLRAGDETGGQAALSRAGEMALALTVPAAVALVAIPGPLVSVLFERGEFGPEDTARTALALAVYGAGLPAFVMQKVLQPIYFAREDTRTPFRYALVAMLVNAVVAVGLGLAIGYLGAAIGTTVAGWAMVWLLSRGRDRMGGAAAFDDRYRTRAVRIVAASLLMGVVLWLLARLLGPALASEGWRYLALAALVGTGGAAYFGFAAALGGMRFSELRASLRR
ncbi:murein biosynthesis integral membrane protein MurJ [Rhodobacterales bacterium HKCCE2091]|nr:murein biosynthesis integral membrane protein MurJ [Rhodobacterales bacterium HKCCE2091]